MMFLWMALTMGLIGSLHCVGMCGPIAMAMPYRAKSKWATGLNIVRYHLGRTLTYALLGGLIGLFGRGLFLAGLQQGFAIGAGVLLLVAAVFSTRITTHVLNIPIVNRLLFKLKASMGRMMNQNAGSTLFLVGMLNGLLPCGLVYLAIVGAIATGDPLKGMGFMAAFGLGTVPLLLLASLAGTVVSLRMRNMLRKLVPVCLVVFGVLLITRGMNFDMPANFSFWEATEHQLMCH